MSQTLSARELDVLAAIERRLTNGEIAQQLFVSVRTVESHVASLRRKLGATNRTQLIEEARRRRSTLILLPITSFVGREAAIAEVGSLLERVRWVTVVGPAGCGKTRLVLELAAGSRWVPVLAELERAGVDDVATVVAGAVGIGADRPGDPIAACAVALAADAHLLILDNADRVEGQVAAIVRSLLAQVLSLRVLATSRSPIGAAETRYALEPLTLGDATTGSIRLFLDRAALAAPLVPLAAPDHVSVARICRRLDGLPLAIELAAARTRHIPVHELADLLERDLAVLDASAPAGRHDTLAAACGWTWDLLDDRERTTLGRLAALPEPFDMELAETICGPASAGVVLRLLDRSLVSPTRQRSEPCRYRLLDTVAAFVASQTDPAVLTDARRAHATYYAGRAQTLAATIRLDDRPEIVAEVKRIRADVVAALKWARDANPALALSLAVSLAVLLEHAGPDVASLDAISRSISDPTVRATATPTELLPIGLVLHYTDLDLLQELASSALARAGDAPSRLAALHLAGWAAAFTDRGQAALAHLADAAVLAIELDDVWQLACIRQAEGIALKSTGIDDLSAALARFEEAADAYAQAGDAMHVNNCRYMMATTAAASGQRTSEAIAWTADCEAYANASGNLHELAHARLTRVQLCPGDDDAQLRESADTFRQIGDLRCLTRTYFALADRATTSHDRVHMLEQAFAVATSAHDSTKQVRALEGLIATHWQAGARREAATHLGALLTLVGHDDAIARIPREMQTELPHLKPAIAEGRARAIHLTHASGRDEVARPSGSS